MGIDTAILGIACLDPLKYPRGLPADVIFCVDMCLCRAVRVVFFCLMFTHRVEGLEEQEEAMGEQEEAR